MYFYITFIFSSPLSPHPPKQCWYGLGAHTQGVDGDQAKGSDFQHWLGEGGAKMSKAFQQFCPGLSEMNKMF
jgi:hypothetical protein